jgi:hypothetical protein
VLSVAIVAVRSRPRRSQVPVPAPDLAPQSFGRYTNSNFGVSLLLGGLSLLIVGIIVLIHRRFGELVFFVVFYGLLALSGLLFRDRWVAGGDGWLMLLRGREQAAWVRTARLTRVSLEPSRPGDTGLRLTLRDRDGRELKISPSSLPAEGAASVLAGIEQSEKAGLLDLGSPTATAAVTALRQRTGTTLPKPEPDPEDVTEDAT